MMKQQNNKKIWDRYAKFYDVEVLRFSSEADEEMYLEAVCQSEKEIFS